MQFSRFLSNNRDHTELFIRFMEDTGKVAISFTIYGKKKMLWVSVDLQLEYESYLNAFDRKTSAVDFQLINHSITQTIAGGIPYRPTHVVSGNRLYPNKTADLSGEYFVCNIICSYANGQLVDRTSLFSHCSYIHNYNSRE